FMVGGLLALVVRVQLATPAAAPNTMGGLVTPEFYNQAFTMHASFMLFLFIIPILAGFGNYVVPLQIGAPDMAFPRINALSLWLLPRGRVGLDRVPAAVRRAVQRHRHGPVDHGPGADRDELDPGRHQLPRHDLQ